MPGAHLPVHLLPDMIRNLCHVVWRLDYAEDFLQLSNKPGSSFGKLHSLFTNVNSSLRQEILNCTLDVRTPSSVMRHASIQEIHSTVYRRALSSTVATHISSQHVYYVELSNMYLRQPVVYFLPGNCGESVNFTVAYACSNYLQVII